MDLWSLITVTYLSFFPTTLLIHALFYKHTCPQGYEPNLLRNQQEPASRALGEQRWAESFLSRKAVAQRATCDILRCSWAICDYEFFKSLPPRDGLCSSPQILAIYNSDTSIIVLTDRRLTQSHLLFASASSHIIPFQSRVVLRSCWESSRRESDAKGYMPSVCQSPHSTAAGASPAVGPIIPAHEAKSWSLFIH